MDTGSHWGAQPALEAPKPAVPAGPEDSFEPHRGADPFGGARRPLLKRIASGLALAVAAIVKFLAQFKALLLLLPKIKLLAAGGSALVSVAAYALFWGWGFAVGFVVLLFVHEMGHVLQLRREGIRSTLPLFIPFMGAMIKANLWEGDARTEARVGLAGPILGTLGAALCIPLYLATGNELFRALAYVGFLLNLINLLPVLPLDGGRAMAAMAPWMWFVGLVALVGVAIVLPGPIVFLVLFFGGREVWVRWKQRRSRSLEQAAYYRVSRRDRLLVGAVYFGLIILLALGMHATYLHRTIG